MIDETPPDPTQAVGPMVVGQLALLLVVTVVCHGVILAAILLDVSDQWTVIPLFAPLVFAVGQAIHHGVRFAGRRGGTGQGHLLCCVLVLLLGAPICSVSAVGLIAVAGHQR